MNNIIEYLKSLPKAHFATGASLSLIEESEGELGLKFSSEYKSFLLNFGGMMYKGMEILGLTENHVGDTVQYTIDAREDDKTIPSNLYVIGSAGMDGILYMQGADGTVYSHAPFGQCVSIAISLEEYIKGL